MINIAIVEDEDLYAEQLMHYLNQYQEYSGNELKLTRFMDGDEIIETYDGSYDIILMDIEMKFMNGMEAAYEIRKSDKEVIIMFITNMIQYAIQGYQVNALDYILKPVEFFAFSQKLDRAIDQIRSRVQKYILITVSGGVQKIDVDHLFYVESQNHDLIFWTTEGSYLSRGTMNELEKSLNTHTFFRVSKSYLVNLKYVVGIDGGFCKVQQKNVPISRAKKKDFYNALISYMSEVS